MAVQIRLKNHDDLPGAYANIFAWKIQGLESASAMYAMARRSISAECGPLEAVDGTFDVHDGDTS